MPLFFLEEEHRYSMFCNNKAVDIPSKLIERVRYTERFATTLTYHFIGTPFVIATTASEMVNEVTPVIRRYELGELGDIPVEDFVMMLPGLAGL